MKRLYMIEAPHFVAAFVVDSNSIIIRSAPILAWARGKNLTTIEQYCQRKFWKIEFIKEREVS
jgi:hypothetical protein